MLPKSRRGRRKVLNTVPCNSIDTPHPLERAPTAVANRRKAVEALFVENTMLIRGARRREFRLPAKQTSSLSSIFLFPSQSLSLFLLSFVLRLRNYIPWVLSAARNSAIIAESSYNRADKHLTLPYTYILREVFYVTTGTFHPLASSMSHICHAKFCRRRMER